MSETDPREPIVEDGADDSALIYEDTPELPSVSLGPHFEMHPVVFPAGALIVLTLVGLSFLIPGDDLRASFEGVRNWIGGTFGWLYVAAMTGFLVFAVWLALGKYGRVPLGRDGEKPEFNRLTWFAMLFSAGMGIGLVFWSVAEPVEHFNSTPPGFAEGLNPSRLAMAVTIFHWGLHPWALYAVVALALAYFGFRRGLPLGFRSLLYPIFGDKVWGVLGDAIDTLAIIATLTGVATSLGLGAQQVNAGLAFLFGVPIGTLTQVVLIAAITAVATVSVVLGLGTGIRRLSEANMGLAGLLMVMVILGSGVVAFLGSTIENTGAYLQLLPFSSFRTGAISPEGETWLNAWTVFYWAWWISWSPFVGMFIARISRGRTIREFIAGTLVVPTAVGIVWLTAFGATTLRSDVQHERQVEAFAEGETTDNPDAGLGEFAVDLGAGEPTVEPMTAAEYMASPIVHEDTGEPLAYQDKLATVLFVLLGNVFGHGVLAKVAIGIATLCIVLFFVTSSDSASMVIDIIASGGNPDPPVGTRLFWALTEGVVAAALLIAGGLEALQAASITAALPFTIILLLASWALVKGLREERVDLLPAD
jgi:choline/glycine/proline betaine transport protein